MKKTIPDKFLYIPIIILFANFIFRLINQSKMLIIFPLDKYNDWSSYMAQLFFLKVCGFHNFCPYWYNGFINFQINQPGWYFFIYPIYLLTNNVQITAYLSLILTFFLSVMVIYFNSLKLGLSKIKAIAFFLFLFGNSVSIGNYIRTGKVHELFGWFNLIVIFIFLINYKEKKLDKNFLFVIPFYFFAILSHQNTGILASLMLLCLFLIKRFKEKIKIVLVIIISLVSTSFWWIDYIKNFFNTTSKTIIVGNTLMHINKATYSDNIVATVIPLMFFLALYFYLKSATDRKKEIIFFLPQILIGLLLLTRLILFIPILNQVFPDTYALFLLFFIIFMFFNIDFKYIKYKKILFYSLIIVSLMSIILSIIYTPGFISYTKLEDETLSLMPYINDKYIILSSPLRKTSYPNAYYSYGAIYYNLSTASGWYPSSVNSKYINKIENLDNYIKEENCTSLKQGLKELNIKEVITYDTHCKFLDGCGLNNKINKSRACLYFL